MFLCSWFGWVLKSGNTHPKGLTVEKLQILQCCYLDGVHSCPRHDLGHSSGGHHCIKLTLLRLRLIAPPRHALNRYTLSNASKGIYTQCTASKDNITTHCVAQYVQNPLSRAYCHPCNAVVTDACHPLQGNSYKVLIGER